MSSPTHRDRGLARKLIQRVGEGKQFHRDLASGGVFEAGIHQDAKGRTISANEVLRNRGILHATQLERLKTNEVNSVLGYLNNEVLYRVQREVQLGVTATLGRRSHETLKTERYREMIHSVRGILSGGMKSAGKAVKDRLVDIGVHESQFQASTLDQVLPGSSGGHSFGIDITTPSIPNIRAILTSQPFEGRFLKDWFDGEAKAAQSRIERAVNLGIATGETTDQIVRRLTGTKRNGYRDGAFETTRRGAEAITRTAITHVTAHAREMTYKENEEVIKGVRFEATLDRRTTETCASQDGRVFKIDEGPRPPLHFRCRSTTTPVLKSWKELGIDLKEAPPGTRASLNGQIPADTTYGQWLKAQSVDTQNQVLGKKRAEVFRRGALPITRFVDNRLRPLTLGELRHMEARANAKPKGTVWDLPGSSGWTTKGPKADIKNWTDEWRPPGGKAKPRPFSHGDSLTDTPEQRGVPRVGVGKTGSEVRKELIDRLGDLWGRKVQEHAEEVRSIKQEMAEILRRGVGESGYVTPAQRESMTKRMNELADRLHKADMLHEIASEHVRREAHEIVGINGKGWGSKNAPIDHGFTTKREVVPKQVRYSVGSGVRDQRVSVELSADNEAAAKEAELFLKRMVVNSQGDTPSYLLLQQPDRENGSSARGASVSNHHILRGPNRRAYPPITLSLEEKRHLRTISNIQQNVLVGSKVDVETHVHEIAHLIETNNPYWRKQINDFLQSRMMDQFQEAGAFDSTLKPFYTKGTKYHPSGGYQQPKGGKKVAPTGMSKTNPYALTGAEYEAFAFEALPRHEQLHILRSRRTPDTFAQARENWRDLIKKHSEPINANNGEDGLRDRFPDWYIGRNYNGVGTEVTSVFFENLYRDPINFAKRDPELFDLVINLARGHTAEVANMEFRKHVPHWRWKTATAYQGRAPSYLTRDHPSEQWGFDQSWERGANLLNK